MQGVISPPPPACFPPDPYAQPELGLAPEECWFYHTIDIPEYGTMVGQWDLRPGVDDYLGRIDLAGKRVLEFGTASGFLCFNMEQRGADVVALDLAPDAPWDVVPLSRYPDLDHFLQHKRDISARMRNGYWLCHEAFESQARVVYGSVYQVPAAIGPVEVCTFGSILLHLRDPFLALANGLRLTRETVVVTEVLDDIGGQAPTDAPVKPTFRQRARRKLGLLAGGALVQPVQPLPLQRLMVDPCDLNNLETWWTFSPAILEQYLAILGFEDTRIATHQQLFQGQQRKLFTIVGRRTQPMPKRLDGPYPWF